MNEISVKTLYPDGSTSPYRALALPAFASLCLMAGALLVLFRTWDELAVPRWALVLAAAVGYVSASAAHRLSRRHGAFYLLGRVRARSRGMGFRTHRTLECAARRQRTAAEHSAGFR